MRTSFPKATIVVLALAVCASAAAPASAALFMVSTLTDSGADSLRQAITDANAAAGADTINFSVSGTISLATSLPSITDVAGLTIDGVGQTVTVSGNGAVRVFQIGAGAPVTLNRLTIANGSAGSGGGINNSGTLTITNTTLSGNSSPGSFGGAINNAGGGTLSITNSTFSANSTTGGFGGAIYNNGTTVDITNSTFSGNGANGGFGSSLFNNAVAGFTVRNSIVTNSAGGSNCGGAIANGGNNIDSAASCGWGALNGSMSTTDPLLGVLANNGGQNQTFALLPGSPAIDGVSSGAPNGAPATDQRGVTRPQGTRFDIGAFELAVLVAGVLIPIPTVNVWALALFMLFAGLASLHHARGRAKTRTT